MWFRGRMFHALDSRLALSIRVRSCLQSPALTLQQVVQRQDQFIELLLVFLHLYQTTEMLHLCDLFLGHQTLSAQ